MVLFSSCVIRDLHIKLIKIPLFQHLIHKFAVEGTKKNEGTFLHNFFETIFIILR